MSTAVPSHLLPHAVTLVRPVITQGPYGSDQYDYGAAATRTEIRAWVQQDIRRELTGVAQDGRQTQDQRWLLVTNHADIRPLDRVEWTAPTGLITFQTDGPPAPTYTPAGLHHTEVGLKVITG
jgi:hypothetical protein